MGGGSDFTSVPIIFPNASELDASPEPSPVAIAKPSVIWNRCTLVLKKLSDSEFGWIFSRPVDPVKLNLPDYFDKIKKPMDLGTVKKKLDFSVYRDVAEFTDDVKLVFKNAIDYNGPQSDVTEVAKKTFKIFEADWERVMSDMAKEEETKKTSGSPLATAAPRVTFTSPVADAGHGFTFGGGGGGGGGFEFDTPPAPPEALVAGGGAPSAPAVGGTGVAFGSAFEFGSSTRPSSSFGAALGDLVVGRAFTVSRPTFSLATTALPPAPVLFFVRFEAGGELAVRFADGTKGDNEQWAPWAWDASGHSLLLGGRRRPSMIVVFALGVLGPSDASSWSFLEADKSAAVAGLPRAVGTPLLGAWPAATAAATAAAATAAPWWGRIAAPVVPIQPPTPPTPPTPLAPPPPVPPRFMFGGRAPLVQHPGVTCGVTRACPIVGVRFHLVGADYDVCEAAYRSLEPYEQALFARVERPGDPVPAPTARGGSAAPVTHPGITCDASGECPLVGPRYHLWGRNYDLNERSFEHVPPEQQPGFIKIDGPNPCPANAAAEAPCLIELIVDCSGSMEPLVGATVAGLNSFIQEQRALCGGGGGGAAAGLGGARGGGKATVSLTTFNHRVDRPFTSVPLGRVRAVTRAMVAAAGQTALLDALGSTLDAAPPGGPPRMVVVVTDGLENASTRYTRLQVQRAIERRKLEGWSFVFLAANQDAIATGAGLGIARENACTFSPQASGVAGGWRSASAQVCRQRTAGTPMAFTDAERRACSGL